jgi:hypothetical protein
MSKYGLKQSLISFIAFIAGILWMSALLSGCASSPSKIYVDDETLTTNVKLALYANKEVSAKKIIVATADGVVHLSGFVKEADQIGIAEETANRVSGVKSVDNRIEVEIPSDSIPVLKPNTAKYNKHKGKAKLAKPVKKARATKGKKASGKKTKKPVKASKTSGKAQKNKSKKS